MPSQLGSRMPGACYLGMLARSGTASALFRCKYFDTADTLNMASASSSFQAHMRSQHQAASAAWAHLLCMSNGLSQYFMTIQDEPGPAGAGRCSARPRAAVSLLAAGAWPPSSSQLGGSADRAHTCPPARCPASPEYALERSPEHAPVGQVCNLG